MSCKGGWTHYERRAVQGICPRRVRVNRVRVRVLVGVWIVAALKIDIYSPPKRDKKGQLKPTPWPGMNEYQSACRTSWQYGNEFKHRYTEISQVATAIAMVQQHWQVPDTQCHVHFVWREPHKMRDPDNIQCGAKFVLDGMVLAGALHKDNQRHIDMPTHSLVIDKERPGVTVYLNVIEGKVNGESN